MQKITNKALKELLAQTGKESCVTMYLPTHTSASPPHISENQLRLKNLVSKAQQQLGKHGSDQQLGEELQRMVERITNDVTFWEQQTRGLLICATPGNITMFSLPTDTEEYVAVGPTFHVAPLLGLISDARDFYVLTIAQQGPQLFKGDMYGLYPTKVVLPTSMHEALHIDEGAQKTENQGSATGSSLSTGWFNGRGGARNPLEDDRMKFLRMIDKAVTNAADTSLPLILAGIDAEVAEYRALSKHPHILRQAIHGSYTDVMPQELFNKAHDIITKELVEPQHQAVLEDYKRMRGVNPERIATTPEAIKEAAEQGRIDKLIARMSRLTTDTVRDTMDASTRITFPEASLATMLNDMALKVWNMSGTIVNLPTGQLPGGSTMVARLRY